MPSYEDVVSAHERIGPYIVRTPTLHSPQLSRILKKEIFIKCENLQVTGSFKPRGALNSVLKKSPDAVAAHSSGNHAGALAYAAKIAGIGAHLVVPSNARQVKIDNILTHGGEITFCEPTLESRESTLKRIIQETGATEIHPYNDEYTIAGQGTAAREAIEDSPFFDAIVAPVGGGGLASGTVISAGVLSPQTAVYGAEPANADDAKRSLKAGKIIPSNNPDTIADGLRTSLGTLTFPILKSGLSGIVTASEEGIKKTVKLFRDETGMLAEPSAVVPLAALMENPVKGGRILLIVSGGNASPVDCGLDQDQQ